MRHDNEGGAEVIRGRRRKVVAGWSSEGGSDETERSWSKKRARPL